MALKKTKEMNTGVAGEYWRIEDIDIKRSSLSCVVKLYKDETAAEADKLPLYSETAGNWQMNTRDIGEVDMYVYCYDKLKESGFFSDAEDC